jgi:biotin carboxyl carrier protein
VPLVRWTARVGGQVHEVDLVRKDDGAVTATVDGRSYSLSLTEPQPHFYSILSEDGASHEAIVQIRQGRCRVRLGSRVFDVVPEESAHGRKGGAVARDSGARASVRAVMPGRVLRVMVETGQKVSARQGLLVVEAMKMENELSSPRDGVVKEVRAVAGQTVENGDLLVVIE